MRKMAFSGNEYSKKRAQMSLAQLGDGGWKQLEQAPEGRVARNMMVGGGVQVELQKQGEEGTEKKVGCMYIAKIPHKNIHMFRQQNTS